MKLLLVLPLLAVPLMATNCPADSLVITYRSGKTQTVNLDEQITNITRTEYRSASSPAPGSPAQAEPAPLPQQKEEKKEQPAPAKGGIRFKWAPPMPVE